MLELCTLASGSGGNCLLISDGRTHLLVDAGISARRICKSLRELEIEPTALAGILITHEHTDHISGLATLTRQLHLPVYASQGTADELCRRIPTLADVLRPFRAGDAFSIDGLEAESFSTPHDTADSVDYAVTDGVRKAAVVTDLGYVTETVAEGVRGANLLVVESNHDEDWLQSGPYPYSLKRRILGDRGHLSNEAGAALACSAVEQGAHTVILAHLSAENNTPVRAYEVSRTALARRGAVIGQDVMLEVAPRSEPGRRYRV